MRALQPRNRPATPLRFRECVIIDRRRLDEAGANMLPVGKFDRVVEPADVHSWQLGFESGEGYGIACQNIQADRHSPRIARKPPRPDWKHPVGSGNALDVLV